MPEQPEAEAVETNAPEEVEAEPTQQTPKPTETVEFWKTKARENEKRAKANADAAERLAAYEESQKSEQQKLLERAEAAERERDQERAARQIDDWKAKVSKDTGVPADVLRGSDLEEIEAHAASLKALLPEPRTPGYVPSEGRTVTGGAGSPHQQFASILKQQLAP